MRPVASLQRVSYQNCISSKQSSSACRLQGLLDRSTAQAAAAQHDNDTVRQQLSAALRQKEAAGESQHCLQRQLDILQQVCLYSGHTSRHTSECLPAPSSSQSLCHLIHLWQVQETVWLMLIRPTITNCSGAPAAAGAYGFYCHCRQSCHHVLLQAEQQLQSDLSSMQAQLAQAEGQTAWLQTSRAQLETQLQQLQARSGPYMPTRGPNGHIDPLVPVPC